MKKKSLSSHILSAGPENNNTWHPVEIWEEKNIAHALISTFTTEVIDDLRWPVPRLPVSHLSLFVSAGLCARNNVLALSFPHTEWLRSLHWTRTGWSGNRWSSTLKVVRYKKSKQKKPGAGCPVLLKVKGALSFKPRGETRSILRFLIGEKVTRALSEETWAG